MASKALLATPDSKIEVDSLRKADVVSVRRLGLLLGDMEVYSADVQSTSLNIRNEFYGLVKRHAITPPGFFEVFTISPTCVWSNDCL